MKIPAIKTAGWPIASPDQRFRRDAMGIPLFLPFARSAGNVSVWKILWQYHGDVAGFNNLA
jgi:hypothetical protein